MNFIYLFYRWLPVILFRKVCLLFLFVASISAAAVAQPVIQSVSPLSGTAGSTITLTGSGFSTAPSDNVVYFGAVRGWVTAATTTVLSVTIPVGATYEPITVTVNGLTAYSSHYFDATFTGITDSITAYTFSIKTVIGTRANPRNVIAADFNRDGKTDILSADQDTNTFSVYQNQYSGSSGIKTVDFDYTASYTCGGPDAFDLATGDFDGDSLPDVAVINFNNGLAGNLAIFRNTSQLAAITFDTASLIFGVGDGPTGIAVNDVNGDGKPDIIVTGGNSDSVYIFKNESQPGSLLFVLDTRFQLLQYRPEDIAAGDINNDGKPDLILTDFTGKVVIIRNESTNDTIAFGQITAYPALQNPNQLVLGDIDGDSKTDIVITNYSAGGLSVYRNNGTGTDVSFEAHVDIATGKNPIGISIGDIDGDGKPDIATTNQTSYTVSVLKNTSVPGTVSLVNIANYNTQYDASGVVVADLDQDGKPDLTVAENTAGQVSVFRNHLQEPSISSFTPASAQAGDTLQVYGLNLGGTIQVTLGNVTAEYTVNSPTSLSVVVPSNPNISGNIDVVTPFGEAIAAGFNVVPVIASLSPEVGPAGTTVTISGFNFNTSPDSNYVNFGATRAQVASASRTSLSVVAPFGATYEPVSVTVKGYTGYSAHPFISTFAGGLSFSDSSFADTSGYPSSGYTRDVVALDFDGDGKVDLATIAQTSDQLVYYANTSQVGSITLSQAGSLSIGVTPFSLIAGDIDGDGKPDLVSNNYGGPADNQTLSVYINTSQPGAISFAPAIQFPAGPQPISTNISDLDGDGKPDLVVSSNTDSIVSILRNTTANGTVSFAERITFRVGNFTEGTAVKDLDGDGKPDIVAANLYDSTISILKNLSTPGAIYFGRKQTIATGAGPTSATAADLDGDGKYDIVVPNSDAGTISLYKNVSADNDTIVLAPRVDIPVGSLPLNVSAGDLDGDGRPDLAVVNFGSNTVSILKNTCTPGVIQFAAGQLYATNSSPRYDAIADLDNDGKPDMAISCSNSYDIKILRNTLSEPAVLPSGSNPVAGDVRKTVFIDSTVQTSNGVPYVQRHYDIEPQQNAATATATLTLYFTQTDFDNFNAFPAHGLSLPASPADATGITNLRIHQYHGSSAAGVPGSYGDSETVINPDDSKIVWNAAQQYWTVTFDVTGFSGFFATSEGNVLPLRLLSFTGTVTGNRVSLEWKTADETSLSYFELQRSYDNRSFLPLATLPAGSNAMTHTYQYSDELSNPVVYYRLSLKDNTGKATNSNTLFFRYAAGKALYLQPNPAIDFVVVQHPQTNRNAQIQVADMGGRVVKRVSLAGNTAQTTLSLQGLTPGLYKVTWQDGNTVITRSLQVK